MALIKCPRCGATVSDRSPNCVHCGCLLSSNSSYLSSEDEHKHKFTVINEASARILQGNLPVLLEKAVLMKDELGELSAVIRFISLSEEAIQALQLDILCSDIWGEKLAPVKDVQYLDLETKRDEPFGENRIVDIPDNNARILEIVVQRVMLDDGTLLSRNSENQTVPEPRPLSLLLDEELVKEYQLNTSNLSKCVPEELGSIWRCACGAINRKNEKICHNCATDFSRLTDELDKENLQKKVEKRRQELFEKAERERKAQEERARTETEKEEQAKLDRAEKLRVLKEKAQNTNDKENVFQGEASGVTEQTQKKKKTGIVILASVAVFAVLLFSLKTAGVFDKAPELPPQEENTIIEEPVHATAEPKKEEPPAELTEEERIYLEADKLASEGKYYEAATTFYKIKDYKDAWDRCFSLWGRISVRYTFGSFCGIRADGSLSNGHQYGEERKLNQWKNIESIELANWTICGLKSDGTISVVDRSPKSATLEISDWRDIVAFSLSECCIIGIKADGTVSAKMINGVGKDYGQCDVSQWSDIVMVATGGNHTVGLKRDGTVLATGLNRYKQCEVEDWENIVFISASENNTIGVKSDGTVIAIGDNGQNQCAVSTWKEIREVQSNSHYTIGLKEDGTVVITANQKIFPWTDIICLAPAKGSTIPLGLRSNGDAVWVINNTVANGDEEKMTVMHGLKVPSS